jgi:hypothetical protein
VFHISNSQREQPPSIPFTLPSVSSPETENSLSSDDGWDDYDDWQCKQARHAALQLAITTGYLVPSSQLDKDDNNYDDSGFSQALWNEIEQLKRDSYHDPDYCSALRNEVKQLRCNCFYCQNIRDLSSDLSDEGSDLSDKGDPADEGEDSVQREVRELWSEACAEEEEATLLDNSEVDDGPSKVIGSDDNDRAFDLNAQDVVARPCAYLLRSTRNPSGKLSDPRIPTFSTARPLADEEILKRSLESDTDEEPPAKRRRGAN